MTPLPAIAKSEPQSNPVVGWPVYRSESSQPLNSFVFDTPAQRGLICNPTIAARMPKTTRSKQDPNWMVLASQQFDLPGKTTQADFPQMRMHTKFRCLDPQFAGRKERSNLETRRNPGSFRAEDLTIHRCARLDRTQLLH